MITTQRQIRALFWQVLGYRAKRMRSGDYPCDVRCAFVAFVDALSKDGTISESLAARVVL